MSAAFSNAKAPAGLLALSGMAYAGGKYTAEEWKEKTGFDPRDFRRWFYVSPRNQFCVMTEEGRRDLEAHHAAVRRNWHALGVPC